MKYLAKYTLGGKPVSRTAYMKELNRVNREKGLRGSWRFLKRGTPDEMKALKKTLDAKNPLREFRTAKDWKPNSRILEVKEWLKY